MTRTVAPTLFEILTASGFILDESANKYDIALTTANSIHYSKARFGLAKLNLNLQRSVKQSPHPALKQK